MLMKNKNKPHFLFFNPPHYSTPQHHDDDDDDDDDEFDESDVVWSTSTQDTTAPDHTTTTTTSSHSHHHPIHFHSSSPTTGLSVALLSSDSPSSLHHRITTISSPPLSRSSDGIGPDLLGPSYFAKNFHQSAPVNVPVWPNPRTAFGIGPDEEEGHDDDGSQDDADMVPPHEIVARSHKTTTFSMIEGAGRTLKGRDLTRVRNAVFQKTGFLD